MDLPREVTIHISYLTLMLNWVERAKRELLAHGYCRCEGTIDNCLDKIKCERCKLISEIEEQK